MARKPLIDPNALNRGGSTPQSTISRILQRDRETSGRADPTLNEPEAPAPVEPPTGEPVNSLPSQPANPVADEPAHTRTGAPAPQPAREATPSAPTRTPKPVQARTPKGGERKGEESATPPGESEADRLAAAEARVEAMGQSPMKQIGPRIPGEWDDWLEDYVYARRKTGLQKQDLVRRLIRDFIVAELARDGDEG